MSSSAAGAARYTRATDGCNSAPVDDDGEQRATDVPGREKTGQAEEDERRLAAQRDDPGRMAAERTTNASANSAATSSMVMTTDGAWRRL